jgi:eukaryotic-like serine/threonine-protein kinase
MLDPRPSKNTVDIRREAKHCPTCGQLLPRDARYCPFDGVELEPQAFDPLLGSTIDARYQVVELLGEGGTGRVYKVRHTALGRLFAMKLLRRDLARDEELAARFIQEAKATASVRHPNVVQITDFGTLPDGVPYLVTELLVGRTLREVIKEGGPIALARAAHIVKQIAGALGAAHAVGIVHRDLKPDNVFLVDAEDVRIVDFGAAKVVGASRMTRDGIVFGTPHYMSPEQASGQPVDHRADIYSLGVIIYEMLTGRVPFEADTYTGVLTQHMFVNPVPPSQVIAGARELGALEEIALVCLAKKPEQRYPSMGRLEAEVDRAGSGLHRAGGAGLDGPNEAGAPALDEVPSPRRPAWWGWVVIGCMFLALLGWAWVGRKAANETVGRKAANETVGRKAANETVGRKAANEVDGRNASPRDPAVVPEIAPGIASTLPAAVASASGASPSPFKSAPSGTHGAGNARSAGDGIRRPPPPPKGSAMDDVGDPFATRR